DRTGAAVTAIGQPRPASEPQALAQAPRGRQVVVIDAGHGGHDPGANSRHATEKAVVLAVARMLAERLEAAGLEVILTRDHDTFLTLQQRSEFATTDKNIFVSIHANSADKSSAEGIETWVFGEPLDPALIERAIRENGGGAVGEELTREARRVADQLAFDILREAQFNLSLSLAESVQSHLVSATGAKDRGVRTNLFYVLRTARIPAILVELGFVSNPDEGSRLSDPRYQAVLADGLADGILAFLANGGAVARR
ncbi:MAG TPA: N-acetylmuramoyl-L-alanine amidase, partial [Trueperaceae bacterium]|nr:N-acetylmuramoyl-L-alanine amidase [Trueperaceae bacterium]